MIANRKPSRRISILPVFRAWIASAVICAGLAFLIFELSNWRPKPPHTLMGDIASVFLKPGLLLWLRLGLGLGRAGFGNWLDAAIIVVGSALAWSIPLCAILVWKRRLLV
jgi:hypothetical protein